MKFEWNNGDNSIEINWISELKPFTYTKFKLAVDKYVDNTYSVTHNIGWLSIKYNNWNYNNICHVMLRSDKMFKNSSSSDAISSLQESLRWMSNISDDFNYKVNPLFSFAVETKFDENGNEYKVYYITVKKDWLIKNNLHCLADSLYIALNRDDIIANKNKFPKYHKYKKEIIYL